MSESSLPLPPGQQVSEHSDPPLSSTHPPEPPPSSPPLPDPVSVGLCRYCGNERRLWAVQHRRGWVRLICGDCLYRAIREATSG